MIASLLIANRGEIACRVIRTARHLGVRTIAVYSDADANALHVRLADEAVHIGPSAARESYLVGENIIAAAKAVSAEAIHPGYGFLSENAEFAEAVIKAGKLWVGPKPHAIRAMGLKDAAKKLMAEAGVPITPGYMGEDQAPDVLAERASEIGYPVLIKAVAGGGGKGMRLVERAEDFAEALASCQREAAASFGNAHVLIEKYIERPRHIEVQIFGDSHGDIVHLFERDCSLQRRHQKIIEEAPAPGMDAATREAVCAAAIKAAKAVDYVGAGTVEFIADASEGLRADRIWFMEMNTRLQVEHPVTEAITGIDLVEWQLRIASGEPLPKRQVELHIQGWAMEARLYAEDPTQNFMPSVGPLEIFQIPHSDNVRIDSGVAAGDAISPFYDPMIAKLIAHGRDRGEARARLRDALAESVIWPIKTNAAFLVNALEHPDFSAGAVDTGLIARAGEALTSPPHPSPQALTLAARQLVEPSATPGFRLNAAPTARAMFLLDGAEISIALDGEGADAPAEETLVHERGAVWRLTRWRKHGACEEADATGALHAPMPGRVSAVFVKIGESVKKGQSLLTLEAMKMEHALAAPFDGEVAALHVRVGDQVRMNTLLIEIAATS